MPSAVAKATLAATSVAPVLVTVKSAVPSASFTVTSSMANTGAGSSLVIVPVPSASPIVAPEAPLKVTVKVSSFSNTASSRIVTVIVCDSSPTAKFNVPEAAR